MRNNNNSIWSSRNTDSPNTMMFTFSVPMLLIRNASSSRALRRPLLLMTLAFRLWEIALRSWIAFPINSADSSIFFVPLPEVDIIKCIEVEFGEGKGEADIIMNLTGNMLQGLLLDF